MPYKIAFFDIDNTLFDWKNMAFVQSGIDAIKRLKKEGVLVVLCTARPYHSAKHFGVFDLGIHFDGFIGSAGGITMYHNKVIHMQVMDRAITKKLCKYIVSKGLTAEVITAKNRFLIAEPNQFLLNFHEIYCDVIPEVHPYYGEKSTGLLLHCPVEYDEDFLKEFPTISFYRFDSYGVDVMPAPRNKGEAMLELLSYLGLSKEDAIAYGDDYQDMSMKQGAYFVCLGNGREEVKQEADEVADMIWNDGLAKSIKNNFGW